MASRFTEIQDELNSLTGGSNADACFIPRPRSEGITVVELNGEILVYDLERHKAHCLNPSAAAVWRMVNGSNTIPGIVQLLQTELGEQVDDSFVQLALERLARRHLLEERKAILAKSVFPTRRQVLKRVGLTVALPLVTSILAPTAAQAASCLGSGANCSSSSQCCSGVCAGGGCV